MARRVVVDKSENQLRLYEGSQLIRTYPVATGADQSITPEGRFTIVFKTHYPGWTNPRTNEFIPGCTPHNPLGTRWLGLSIGGGRRYGIHGTNDPSSIGKRITLGCVRMYNEDVQELYDLVPLGTIVTIQP